MTDNKITIHMDRKCVECRSSGALDNGICLSCAHKAMIGKTMKSAVGRAVQKHIQRTLDAARQARSTSSQ
jgi:hypothetical protein